jgi:hypothetical protein
LDSLNRQHSFSLSFVSHHITNIPQSKKHEHSLNGEVLISARRTVLVWYTSIRIHFYLVLGGMVDTVKMYRQLKNLLKYFDFFIKFQLSLSLLMKIVETMDINNKSPKHEDSNNSLKK